MKPSELLEAALGSKLMGLIGVVTSAAATVYHGEAQGATLPAKVTSAVLENPVSWFWIAFLSIQIVRQLIDWFRSERRYRRARRGKGPDDATVPATLRQADGKPWP